MKIVPFGFIGSLISRIEVYNVYCGTCLVMSIIYGLFISAVNLT